MPAAARSHVILALWLITLGVDGCSHDTQVEPNVVLRRGLSSEPSSLDPAAAADRFSDQVIKELYEGLTAEAPGGGVVPAAAESWSVDPTGLKYTFRIRSSAHWSNGKALRAQDFVAAWRRVVDPKQASPVAENFRMIHGASSIIGGQASPDTLGVAAPAADVLTVTLDFPAPYLPQILSHSAAMPIFSETSAKTHVPGELISNGPYVMARWTNGSSMELKKNPNYWDRSNVQIPVVRFEFASDEATQYAQFRAGELDMTDTVPATAVPGLRAAHSKELIIASYLATAYYGLNLDSQPLAAQSSLRQALSMAIDRQRLVDSFGFGQPPAFSFVPPGIWNFEPQLYAWRTLPDEDRMRQAKELYAKAGYSMQHPLHLRVLFNSNVVIKRTAIMIAAMWKEALGIDCELDEEEYRSFLVSRKNRTHWDVARLAWVADFDDASNFLETLRSTSSNNDEAYSNTAFDKLLDDANTTPDATARRNSLQSAERMMLEDYPVIPLYYYVSKRLVKSYVQGVQPTPTDQVPSKLLRIAPH